MSNIVCESGDCTNLKIAGDYCLSHQRERADELQARLCAMTDGELIVQNEAGDEMAVRFYADGTPREARTPFTMEQWRDTLNTRFPAPDGCEWDIRTCTAYCVRRS